MKRTTLDPAKVCEMALGVVATLGDEVGKGHNDPALITDGIQAAARAFADVVAREFPVEQFDPNDGGGPMHWALIQEDGDV